MAALLIGELLRRGFDMEDRRLDYGFPSPGRHPAPVARLWLRVDLVEKAHCPAMNQAIVRVAGKLVLPVAPEGTAEAVAVTPPVPHRFYELWQRSDKRQHQPLIGIKNQLGVVASGPAGCLPAGLAIAIGGMVKCHIRHGAGNLQRSIL